MFHIPLMRPSVGVAERDAIIEVLDSGMLTEGTWTGRLEDRVARFVGSRHAIAVTSCTTGLEIALRALGIGPGDEVILPDYTYPATASAVAVAGARPVLVDIDPQTMLIDLEKAALAVTPRTRALLPVSLFGNPLDAPALDEFCSTHGLALLEDAACSLGAELDGRRVGSLARVSVFSLHPRKMITTGEGGIITTDDEALSSWMRSYKHFGMEPASPGLRPRFVMLGSNARLSDVLAAMGVSQMERLESLLATRRSLARSYETLLSGISRVSLPTTTAGGLHAQQSFCIFIPERDRVMRTLRARGIEVQIGSYSLHREPAFANGQNCQLSSSYPGSNYAFDHCLALPLFDAMSPIQQQEVVENLDRALHPSAKHRAPQKGSTCVAS